MASNLGKTPVMVEFVGHFYIECSVISDKADAAQIRYRSDLWEGTGIPNRSVS